MESKKEARYTVGCHVDGNTCDFAVIDTAARKIIRSDIPTESLARLYAARLESGKSTPRTIA